jgi:hypothetical protein
MKSAAIIDEMRADGISLDVTPDYQLQVSGKSIKPKQVELLKGHRDEIIEKLCGEQFQFEVFRITLPDDVGFVLKRLQHESNRTRLAVIKRWHSEFAKAWQAEPNLIAKDNAGRFRANSWLRELDVPAFCETSTKGENPK